MNEENVMTTNEMNREERMPFFRIPKVILTDENQRFVNLFFILLGCQNDSSRLVLMTVVPHQADNAEISATYIFAGLPSPCFFLLIRPTFSSSISSYSLCFDCMFGG